MTSNQLKATVTDLLWKAANTFWQTFAAVFVVTDFSSAKQVGLAAFAAGLSAVKTFVSEYLRTKT